MKTCSKCKETKPFTEFHKHKGKKDGHKNHCKVCRVETTRQYRQKNKEAISERARRHYQENREAVLERNQRWYQENKEAVIERQRRYKQENREAINERARRHYQENREAVLERSRLVRKEREAKQPGCVYQIANSINGRVYVGQTTRGEFRWRKHLSCLRGNRHENPNLQADFDEFGEEAFEWSIIQELPKDKEVLEREETNTIERLLAEGKELYNVHKN